MAMAAMAPNAFASPEMPHSRIPIYRKSNRIEASGTSSPGKQLLQAKAREPLKVMISGAPASGKGTQCELIREKYGLVHIAAGDLLRAEVAAGTADGRKAQQFMNEGKLVPNDIVVAMVKKRLEAEDALQKGWLLDGYPRSLSQADALESLNIRPHVFLLLEVPDTVLVERVAGRRLDPVTGKIYHLKYEPPETAAIKARLIQREDDTEERVRLRLKTHRQNVEAVLAIYSDSVVPVDGNRRKDVVFSDIDAILADSQQELANEDSMEAR